MNLFTIFKKFGPSAQNLFIFPHLTPSFYALVCPTMRSKTPDPSSMSRGLYQNQQDQNWLTQNQNQSYPQNVLNPPGPHQQKVQIQGYPAQNTQGRNNWAQSSNNHSGNSSGRQSAPIPGTGIYNDGGFGRESPVLDSGGNPVRKKKRKKDKSHK